LAENGTEDAVTNILQEIYFKSASSRILKTSTGCTLSPTNKEIHEQITTSRVPHHSVGDRGCLLPALAGRVIFLSGLTLLNGAGIFLTPEG
jgi:hypothetical protein